MTTTATKESPTYGNWQQPRSAGLGRLGTGGTFALFVGVTAVIIGLAVHLLVGVVLAGLVALTILPLLIQDQWGRNLYQRVSESLEWRWHRHQGRHLYTAGPLSRTPEVICRLPGLAARIEGSEARDAHGRPFALLHHPVPGHVATVIECSPPGDVLVDPETVDGWVAGWGAWLASLGHEPGVVAAQVSVETAPDTGIRLRRAVEDRLVPDAPALAVEAMREIVATYPSGTAATTCRVALTWSRARPGGRRRPLDEMAVEIGSRLPEICAGLAWGGGGVARPLSLNETAAAMRVAWDPDAAPLVEEAGATAAVDWSDAGPVSMEETRGTLMHDGATSVSWVMGEAPRGAVLSNVLRRLVDPHPEVARKRVTLLYRPYGPAKTAAIVDEDISTALFQATQKRRGVASARDALAVRTAQKTAEEEARGAGLVRFGMIVTATTPGSDSEAVERSAAVVEHLGASSRIRLRRAWRRQATTFTAGLPLGLVIPAHLRLPGDWRERA